MMSWWILMNGEDIPSISRPVRSGIKDVSTTQLVGVRDFLFVHGRARNPEWISATTTAKETEGRSGSSHINNCWEVGGKQRARDRKVISNLHLICMLLLISLNDFVYNFFALRRIWSESLWWGHSLSSAPCSPLWTYLNKLLSNPSCDYEDKGNSQRRIRLWRLSVASVKVSEPDRMMSGWRFI